MVGKFARGASRSLRFPEEDVPLELDPRRISLGDRKVPKFSENGAESSRSRAFFSFGSKSSRSEHNRDDIGFLQHLPPKELREEEYVLSALMANSR